MYLCVRKIGGDKKSTLARDKVSDDLDNIFSLKVLSGVATEDKVIAGVEYICHDVMGLKSPGLVTELLLMIVDVGSDNIKERQSKGVETQLAYLIFDDEIPAECFGNEAVFDGEELSGIITSGAYGYRVGHSVAFAYLNPSHCNEGKALRAFAPSVRGPSKAKALKPHVQKPQHKCKGPGGLNRLKK